MSDETRSLRLEAAALGRYLAGRPIDGDSVAAYERAIRGGCAPLGAREERLLGRAVRHPWLLGFLDAAASVRDRQGGLRRRLLVLFAILEASPHHCDLFLPRPGSRLRVLAALLAAARGAARAAIGIALSVFLR